MIEKLKKYSNDIIVKVFILFLVYWYSCLETNGVTKRGILNYVLIVVTLLLIFIHRKIYSYLDDKILITSIKYLFISIGILMLVIPFVGSSFIERYIFLSIKIFGFLFIFNGVIHLIPNKDK